MAVEQTDWRACGLAWAAKIACSGRYITGRAVRDVLLESAAWTYSTPEELKQLRGGASTECLLAGVEVQENEALRSVTLTKDGSTGTARMHGGGALVVDTAATEPDCAPIRNHRPEWEGDDFFEPADTHSPGISQAQVDAALDELFADPRQMTNACVVLHQGRLIAERYRAPYSRDTQFESWSMGKSLAATLLGRLHQQGQVDLDEDGLFDEWRGAGDARGTIRLRHLLNMSSGLAFSGSFGRGEDTAVKARDGRFLDHIYVYASGCDSYGFCAGKPREIEPGSQVRYRNCDPLLAMKLLVERSGDADGATIATLPERLLLNELGARGFVLETDPVGGFLISGHDYARARDWARLAQLWLQRGSWRGKRLLEDDFVDFALTPAPGSEVPYYGGFMRLNRGGDAPGLPPDAYWYSGGGSQRTVVVPSKDLVVVRLGHIFGARFKLEATLQSVYAQLCEAVS
ncbi:MAG: serine hydrolase [Pseudomonadota bacterium]